jgi:hypothetical protein
MKDEIQKLVADISELVRNECFTNRFIIDQKLTMILDASDGMEASHDALSKGLEEAKQSLARWEDRSRGWMNSVHELTKDKETLTTVVNALAKVVAQGIEVTVTRKGGES